MTTTDEQERDDVMTRLTHSKIAGRAPRLMFVITILTMLCFVTGEAQAQKKFTSPDEAVTALVAAVRGDNVRDMILVLGSAGREVVLSGDDVADQKARAAFMVAYDLRHQIARKGDSAAELLIGPNDWPFPIPLVQKGGSWQFDTASGRQEILYRRIGRNELAAIQVCLAYVDAQNEYASMNPLGAKVESYAQRIISSPGKKDGLYWPAAASEPKSPLGVAAALASLQGYRFGGANPAPYHGYYYKILTGQGPTAPGGSVNYVVNGSMIGGFALVAYPAEYGNSGVMTFLVNHTGAIFQKDLGAHTAGIASRMTLFAPDHTWKRVPASDLAAN
jgi:hypothetical protein